MKSKTPNKSKSPVAATVELNIPPVIIVTPAEKKALRQLLFEQEEKGKRAAELVIANKELAFQKTEKKNRAAELVIADKELIYQKKEKGKRAAELVIANKELLFQNKEKEKKAAELIVANKELLFQNQEKENRASELVIANKELIFQNKEKEKRAAELIIANKELAFQNQEKENRASELAIANKELLFQNKEKEKRAAELAMAIKELKSQNVFKEGLQAELISANIELVYQNKEKEKREGELLIANVKLAFENTEKENRASELVVANAELVFQNVEKEKRAAELLFANTELIAFNYVSSHDLQEPLRKIQTFTQLVLQTEQANLSDKGLDYFRRISLSAARMQELIEDLLLYSRTNAKDRKFVSTDLAAIIEDIKADLKETIDEKHAVVETGNICPVNVIPFQMRQLMTNLITNSLKFASVERTMHIQISSIIKTGDVNQDVFPGTAYCHIEFKDNGIGFDPLYRERIFEVFQKLHGKEEYKGTGIGLAIVKKIVENHHGMIRATGVPGKGARFDIYLPINA